MLQHNTRHSILFPIIFALWSVAIALAGCTDDLIDKTVDIPDTEVELRGEVIFKPLVPMEVTTRAEAEAPEGSEYNGIKSLYIFFFNSKEELIKEYSGDVSFTPAPSEGSTHERVTFTKRIRAGYYYIFAVANISAAQKSDLEKVTSIEALRNFKLVWNDDIKDDLEMFGVFNTADTGTPSAPDNKSFEENRLLTINKSQQHIHSWVRRAASKVTIDFDGTNLKDGVTVYIKNAVLKDVASGVLLGAESKAVSIADTEKTATTANDDKIVCTQSRYSITYGTGTSYSAWLSVTNKGVPAPSTVWKGTSIVSFHDDNAKALPCYENMQGVHEDKSKLQDSDGDGVIDSETKDGVDNGTYLEVEGYYVADRSEYKSQGKIIYRFMLGKDAVKNFDLVRNHHYKITMQFKGYGNDIDWHIVYGEKYLDATYPEDVNYQGKFFKPDPDYNIPNAGHTFDDRNMITVTSFETNGAENKWIEPKISYTYYKRNDKTGEWIEDNDASWLECTKGEESDDGSQKPYTFVASMADPVGLTFPTDSKGNKDVPYNLSNEKGEGEVENTANCYMVGAPGWYCFPLVYGNAITGGVNNKEAYSSVNIKNHLNKNITNPYIKDNDGITLSNISVKLIWQDAEDLIPPREIEYVPSLFSNDKGWIRFHISNIREGNAVIALIDNNADEDKGVYLERETYGTGGSTKAIWSWHIWATPLGSNNYEKNIQITNHKGEAFEVMPVNLGWCGEGQYYKHRKCEITFKAGEHEIVRTIEQYPHFLLPRGDHPYYQWGRKDPFVGTNLAYGNKPRWTHEGKIYERWSQYNPPRLYNEPGDDYSKDLRKKTKDCLHVLIKNPDKWHNAPRTPKNPNDLSEGFNSINEAYDDLWSNNGNKTVYDPCPPGYQVGDRSVFTGFTTSGQDEVVGLKWHDVLETNMRSDYYESSSINSQVLELYTDTRKIQSIIFPVSGYRDYDKKAGVVSYPTESYNGEGFVWFNVAESETNSYHLKFIRSDLKGGDWKTRDGLIAPWGEKFFNTDGFGVRPVRCSTK